MREVFRFCFNTLKVLLTLISVLSAAVFICLLLSCNLKDIKICSIDQARVAFNSFSFIQFQPQVPSSVNQNLLLIFCYWTRFSQALYVTNFVNILMAKEWSLSHELLINICYKITVCFWDSSVRCKYSETKLKMRKCRSFVIKRIRCRGTSFFVLFLSDYPFLPTWKCDLPLTRTR